MRSYFFYPVFYLSFLLCAASLFFLAAPLALFVCLVGVCANTFLATFYQWHSPWPHLNRTSRSEFKRLLWCMVIFALFVGLSFYTADLEKGLSALHVWCLFSIMTFFFFDTFRCSLSYFGKRKPIVAHVRFFYHASLAQLHFAFGALVTAMMDIVVLTGRVSPLTNTFMLLCCLLIVSLAVTWWCYRYIHAKGERKGFEKHESAFLKNYTPDNFSALSLQERKAYENQF